jgi:predicted LPLAT superfamily acyltransferase
MPELLEHDAWQGNTGGTAWMHRLLIGSFRYVSLRLLYAVMAVCVVPFYMLLAHKGYIAMYHFFRQRMGYGRLKAFGNVYANHYRFGQIILDRFAVYAGKHFEFEVEGNDEFLSLCRHDEGFLVLSCHTGNYELAGYAFGKPTKRFNALVYSGEAPTVMENRNRLLSKNNVRMIPVSSDMSHIFLMNEALLDGEIVSIPGDRIFGSTKSLTCTFLGGSAQFPLGPYAMAAQRNLPVLAIFVMKQATYKYKVYVRRLSLGDNAPKRRDEKAQVLATQMAQAMEQIVRQYPTQWFNYYEFWQHDGQ